MAEKLRIRTYEDNAFINYIRNKDFSYMSARKKKFKERIVLPWEDICDFIRWLANQIEGKGYTGIYGVPRGGTLLAVLLSYKTGLPVLQAPAKNCLIVDNDTVSGFTLAPYYERYDIAVYGKHPENDMNIRYVYKIYDDEDFLVYPWYEL